MANFNTPGTDSAGQIILESSSANDIRVGNTTVTLAQDQINQLADLGTNAPIKSLVQTQATPPLTLKLGYTNAQATPQAQTSPGVGAPSDDSGSAKNATQTAIDLVFGTNQTVPTVNPLDAYTSYTYSASVYLMSPEIFKKMIETGQTNIAGSQLLFQSAGAPVSGRNPYFSNDYYIDHFDIKSVFAGKGTGGANQATEINMTIIEPNGLSLIWNLTSATKDFINASTSSGKPISWQSQVYMLGIRFYGYDDNGNLNQCSRVTESGQTVYIEKYYPFLIKTVKYKVANKLVEYTIEATTTGYQIASGQNRGSIPFNVELTASNVSELLGSTPTTQTNSNIDGREATNTQTPQQTTGPNTSQSTVGTGKQDVTIRQSLMNALNQWQQGLVNNGQYTYPDVYSIEFADDAIAKAKVLVKGGDYKGTGLPVNDTPANMVLQEKQSVDNNTRNIGFTAGQQIVQIIEQVVRKSTYILDQANTVVSERDGVQTPNVSSGKNTAWFKINMQSVPSRWDPKRNDYAYDIKYIVTPYKIKQMVSSYFNTPAVDQPHKTYYYWFTGENTQVLNYEQELNNLYTVIMSGNNPPEGGTSVNDSIKFHYFPRSGQTCQGAEGRANEITANAADYLYGSSDLAIATMTIIGDPDWLPQGETLVFPKSFQSAAFLPDGTINFDATQTLFEIIINGPFDYNFNTGLINPTDPVSNGAQPIAAQSYTYMATECTSEFQKGKFTQTLKGTLYNFNESQVENQGLAGLTNVVAQTVTNARNQTPNNTNPAIANVFPITNPVSTGTTNPPGPIGTVIGNVLPITSNPSPVPAPQPSTPKSNADIAPVTNTSISMTVEEANALQTGGGQLINREP